MMILWLLACGTDEVIEPYTAQQADLDAMVRIEGGVFAMGRESEDAGPYGSEWKVNEMPQHSVTLSPFYIDETEVTVEQWVGFLNTVGGVKHHHPLQPLSWKDQAFEAETSESLSPIRQVSWNDAAVYCAWAGKRLPTEAEWEYAAKGEEGERWPWGASGVGCDYSVYFNGRSLCESKPSEVGLRLEGDSPFGVADMAGNVAEWVWDGYAPYENDVVENPTGPTDAANRVIRGGGFREGRDSIRTTARWGAPPNRRSEGVGFRCAHDG
jgi:sulfatase modifying factor 1